MICEIRKMTGLYPCAEACEWLATQPDLEAAWATCPRGEWLLWLAARVGADRKVLVLAACDCAETSLQYVPAGEDRPRLAIESARARAADPCEQTVSAAAAADADASAYANTAATYAADAHAAHAAAYAAAAADAHAAHAAAHAAAYAAHAAYAATYAADANTAADAADAADAYADACVTARAENARLVRLRWPTLNNMLNG